MKRFILASIAILCTTIYGFAQIDNLLGISYVKSSN